MATLIVLGMVIGLVLGGLGGGGGVLVVPALVFLLGVSASEATTGSLVIVGLTSAVALIGRLRAGQVDWKAGAALGLAGIPAAHLGTVLARAVPQTVLMLAFAGLAVVAGATMLRDRRTQDPSVGPRPEIALARAGGRPDFPGEHATGTSLRDGERVPGRGTEEGRYRHSVRVAQTVGGGATIGLLTGFLGVGGGFLVVPVLTMVFRMRMPVAVGTSLLIIVLNSGASLISRIGGAHVDWSTTGPFAAAAMLSALVGQRIVSNIPVRTLSRCFAGVLLAVGAAVAAQSISGLVLS